MRLILCSMMVVAAVAMNGCSSSSSAQSPGGGNFGIPVGVIGNFNKLNNDILLLNTQTDTPGGSLFDVWVHDLSTGQSALLMEDAYSLLNTDDQNVWNDQTFLATPFDSGSNEKAIWITDGTSAGTRLLVDLSTDPSISFQLMDVHVVGNQLVINVSEFDPVSELFNPHLVVVDLNG